MRLGMIRLLVREKVLFGQAIGTRTYSSIVPPSGRLTSPTEVVLRRSLPWDRYSGIHRPGFETERTTEFTVDRKPFLLRRASEGEAHANEQCHTTQHRRGTGAERDRDQRPYICLVPYHGDAALPSWLYLQETRRGRGEQASRPTSEDPQLLRNNRRTGSGRLVEQPRILRPECGLRTGRIRSHPGFRKPPRSAGRLPDIPAIRTPTPFRYVIVHSNAPLFRTAGLGQNPAVHTPIGSDAALEARRRPSRSAVIVEYAAQRLVEHGLAISPEVAER
jgi:hypothetical protein